jgi:hypothetical protein
MKKAKEFQYCRIALSANSCFAKAGVSCFYESELLNSSFEHLMKFSAKNPHLRVAINPLAQGWEPVNIKYLC